MKTDIRLISNGDAEWRPIPELPGYSVSACGKVKRTKSGKPKKVYASAKGYKKIFLRGTSHFVHVLVMSAFVGPKPEGMQVGHKNHDKADNRLCNLAYVTASENTLHNYRDGRVAGQLKPDTVRAIRESLDEGETQRMIASVFGVGLRTVEAIRAGDRYHWVK